MSVSDELDRQQPEPEEPARVPPIHNRFLFVDVAAQRAKQLRRGALPRLQQPALEGESHRPDIPLKLERVAMEEVRQGIISYELPELKALVRPGGA